MNVCKRGRRLGLALLAALSFSGLSSMSVSAAYSLHLNKKNLSEIRSYVEEHGLGNSVSDDGLAGLWNSLEE